MRPAGPHRGHEPKAREAAVPDQHIVRLQHDDLLEGHVHFAARVRFQPGVQAHVIEQIVEHTESSGGITGARGPVLVGDFDFAEVGRQFLALGQAGLRAVHAQRPMAAPSAPLGGLLRGIEVRQQNLLIQFEEGGVLQFGARLGPAAGGDGGRVALREPLGQELVQVPWHRLGGFLQDHQQHDEEGERALAREVNRAAAMGSPEQRVAHAGAQLDDEVEEMSGGGGQIILHALSMYT